MDLTGSAFSKGTGRGIGRGHGLISQAIGIITPCACAVTEKANAEKTVQKIAEILLNVIILSLIVIRVTYFTLV